MENNLYKDDIIIFRSKKSLDKFIMANTDYHYLLQKKSCKYSTKIQRLKFI